MPGSGDTVTAEGFQSSLKSREATCMETSGLAPQTVVRYPCVMFYPTHIVGNKKKKKKTRTQSSELGHWVGAGWEVVTW